MASSLVTLHLPRLYRDRDYVHEVYVLGQSREIVARLTCNMSAMGDYVKSTAPGIAPVRRRVVGAVLQNR
jgi:hypothetical protein